MSTRDPRSNPCLKEQTNYENAVKKEQDLLNKFRAARRTLETMKGTVNTADYREAARALNLGDWPESILGPLDQTSPAFHQTHSASFIKCAKAVYLSWHAYHDALAETAKVQTALNECKMTGAYRKWLTSRAETTPCGAICTSRGREGKHCSRPLTDKRVCSSHGQRPLLAMPTVG